MIKAKHLSVLLLVLASACGPKAKASAPSDVLGKPVRLDLPSDKGALGSVPAAGAAVTVADFWAPTCVPCQKKVPDLVARKADLAAKGATLVLVAVLADSESTALATETLASWGVSEAFLVDRGNASQSEAGVRELPMTLVFQGETVVWVSPADASAEDVVAAVP